MKQIKHTLAGKDFSLYFGIMCQIRHSGDFYGTDPITTLQEVTTDMNKQVEFLAGILYSGANAYNELNNLPFISKDEARNTILRSSEPEAAGLATKYQDEYFRIYPERKEQGEVKPQQKKPSVGKK